MPQQNISREHNHNDVPCIYQDTVSRLCVFTFPLDTIEDFSFFGLLARATDRGLYNISREKGYGTMMYRVPTRIQCLACVSSFFPLDTNEDFSCFGLLARPADRGLYTISNEKGCVTMMYSLLPVCFYFFLKQHNTKDNRFHFLSSGHIKKCNSKIPSYMV